MSFALNINKWVKKTGLRTDVVMRKLALDVYSLILQGSPVDTGRFRGNWVIGVGERGNRKRNVRFAKNASPGVGITSGELSDANARLSVVTATSTVFISNSLPYAVVLENGSSSQAPNGVLKVAVAKINADFKRLVTNV